MNTADVMAPIIIAEGVRSWGTLFDLSIIAEGAASRLPDTAPPPIIAEGASFPTFTHNGISHHR